MIKKVIYEDIIRSIRRLLIDYSGIPGHKILNALSARGTPLAEYISESEEESINMSTSFLLFELIEDQDANNYVTTSQNDGMMTIQAFQFHIMIYGNNCHTDAQKISTLFKQSDNALRLRNEGVFINGVEPVESINEFINDTLIQRCDLFIKLQGRFEFEETSEDVGYFEKIKSIVVERASDK